MTESHMKSTEEWRPVVSFEGWYEVSRDGRLKRVKPAKGTKAGKILNPASHPKGYLHVTLRKDGQTHSFLVHHLVAAAFIGPCPDGMEINHKDTNKRNNAEWNLEYCTPRENIAHAIANGLSEASFAAGRRNSPLTPGDIKEIRDLYPYFSQGRLAEIYGITQSNIRKIIRRESWKHVA